MSIRDAVAILEARRGTMYDEKLVDSFLQLLPTLGVALTANAATAVEPPRLAPVVLTGTQGAAQFGPDAI